MLPKKQNSWSGGPPLPLKRNLEKNQRLRDLSKSPPFEGLFSSSSQTEKKVIWDSQILADFSNRWTVKSIKKIVWDFKKSGSLYVWEFDMNRPWQKFPFFGDVELPIRHGCNYNPHQSDKICVLWFHIGWIIYSHRYVTDKKPISHDGYNWKFLISMVSLL